MEPVVVLGAVARPQLDFSAGEVYDRAFFGLDVADVRAMGELELHLLEVAWEVLERSGADLTRLDERSTAVVVAAGPEAGERTAGGLSQVLGLAGPLCVLGEEGAVLAAVHLAGQLIRAGDAELALVLGALGEGVAGLVLGHPQHASERGWRVRALLLGSDVSSEDEDLVRERARARSGIGEGVARAGASGLDGLVEAVDVLGRGGVGATIVSESAEVSSAAVVVSAAEVTQIGEGAPRWLTLSARTAPSLMALAAEVAVGLAHDSDLSGMAADSLVRPSFERRLAVPCRRGLEDVRDRLRAFATGTRGQVAAGRIAEGGLAFVFPPAGAQRSNMAERMYDSEPAFRDALLRCDKALRQHLPRPLMSALYPSAGRELPTDDPVLANPMTFALGFALAEAYRAHGVVPDAVLGCGVGELVAATVAGVLDLEQAIVLAAERGRLIRTLDVECARVMVEASEEVLRDLVVQVEGVDVVAVPMPDRTVVGGTPEGIADLRELLLERGLPVEEAAAHPAHSPLVEPVLAEFVEAAEGLSLHEPTLPWVSTATGRQVVRPEASHWGSTLRAPLRYALGVEALYELGCHTFVELAAHPLMADAGERTLSEADDVLWLSALVHGVPDDEHTEAVFAELWVRGIPLERGRVGRAPGSADLPTYRWDRRPLEAELEAAEDVELEDHLPWSAEPEPELPDAPMEMIDSDTTLVPAEEQATEEIPRKVLDGGVMPPPGEAEEPTAETEEAPIPSPDEPEEEAEPEAEPELSEDGDLSIDAPPRVRAAVEEEGTDLSEPPAALGSPTSDLLEIDGATAGPPPAAPPPPPPDGAPEPLGDEALADEPLTTGAEMEDLSVDAPAGELEEIETEAYSGTPKALEEAEALADAALVWRERWEEASLEPVEDEEPGVWVILADGEGLGDYLAALLAQRGHTCHRVLHAQPYPRDDGTLFVPDPAVPGAWDEVIGTLGTLHGKVRVIHLWSLDVFDDADAHPRAGWPAVLELAQELHGRGMRMPIQVVTRGAVLRPDPAVVHTAGSLWGVGRLIAAETPEWSAGLVDLDPDDEDADMLLDHLLGTAAGEYAFRDGTRHRRVVERVEPEGDAPEIDAGGAWVIGGDIDAGSLQVAKHLAEHGVGRVFLIGPKPPPGDVLQGVLDLQRNGVMCIVLRADLSDDAEVARVQQRLAPEGALGGVVVHHAPAPHQIMGLSAEDAVREWSVRLASTVRLAELSGQRPVWVWVEGRALQPEAGDGLGAVVGAALDSWARAATDNGATISVLHTAPAGTLGSGQAARLVARLAEPGSVAGAWRPTG